MAIDTRLGKILIVDDHASNVALLEQVLLGAGFRFVVSTTDSRKVRDLHRAKAFDLILLDMQMPMMDGFQVMEQLKQLDPHSYLPVLSITGNADLKLKALKAGARDFVSKPFDITEVVMRVENLLESRLLHQQLHEQSKQLQALALRDPLTGLANRRLLDDRLDLALAHARRNQNLIALLYLDLDGFKAVNDTLGHAAGDALLKEVAHRLLSTVRQEDTVCRLGGDEFVIMLSHIAGIDDATATTAKIIAALSQPYPLAEGPADVTASVGLSVFPHHGSQAQALLQSADAALYEAKREGKNQYRLAHPAAADAGLESN